MTIEIKEGRWFAAMWFLPAKEAGDWMGALYQERSGEWCLIYRFRYYRDACLGPESEDEKSWYTYRMVPGAIETRDETLARFEAVVDDMLSAMRQDGYAEVEAHKISIRSDDPEIVSDLITSQSWSHMTVLDPLTGKPSTKAEA